MQGKKVERNRGVYVRSVESVMEHLFNATDYPEERGVYGRDTDLCLGTYLNGVNEQLGGELFQKNAQGYYTYTILETLFDDFKQRKMSKGDSAGVLMIRPVDVGPEVRGLLKYHSLLLLRPALPRKQHMERQELLRRRKQGDGFSLLPYLSRFRDAIRRYSTEPLCLTTRSGAKQNIKLLWLFINGDEPAGTKLYMSRSHSARRAGLRNAFTGIYLEQAVRFRGYSKPQLQNTEFNDEGVIITYSVDGNGYVTATETAGNSILAVDAQRSNHALIHAAARTAQRLRDQSSDSDWVPFVRNWTILHGTDGKPLPHVDLYHSMLMPIYHKLFFGICRTFMFVVLTEEGQPWEVRSSFRSRMKAMEVSIKLPYGASRPYANLCEYHGGWTMEECKLFWFSLAPILFSGAWTENNSDPYFSLAMLLVRVVRCIFSSDADKEGACESLLKFAKQVDGLVYDDRLPEGMLTNNLSVLVLELHATWTATCNPAVMNELCMERYGRYFLRLGGAASTNVAAFTINQLERMQRVEAVVARHGIELRASRKATTGENRDEIGADGGRWFSSTGTLASKLDDTDAANIRSLIVAYIRASCEAEEADSMVEDVEHGDSTIIEYTSLHSDGREIHATSYTYSKERNSKNVWWIRTTEREVTECEADGISRLQAKAALAAGASGSYIGTVLAKSFELTRGRTWLFCGVVISGSRNKWHVEFTDGEKHTLTRADVDAGVALYEQCRSRVESRKEDSRGPGEQRSRTCYGQVERFFRVSFTGRPFLRVAFVRQFRVVTPSTDTRPHAVVAPTEQVTATVWDKVVDVHDLCGVAVMINLPDDHGTAGVGQVADPRRRAAVSPACY